MKLVRLLCFTTLFVQLVSSAEVSLAGRKASFTTHRPPYAPHAQSKKPTWNKGLSVRGGGTIIDKSTVAQVATGVSSVQGALTYLAPESTCEAYGIKSPSPLSKLIMRRIGVVLLGFGILGYASFFNKNLSIDHAIGLVGASWAIEFATMILSNELVAMGGKNDIHYLYVFIASAFAAGSMSEYSALVSKVASIFYLLNALTVTLAPNKWRELWQLPVSGDETANIMLVDFGLWFVAFAVFAVGLAWGVDPLEAFSYSRIAVLLRTVFMNFLTGAFQQVGMKQANQFLWLLYQSLIVIGLFFGNPGDGTGSTGEDVSA